MYVDIGNAYSRVTGTEEELSWLDSYLTFADANSFWSKAGPIRLLNRFNNQFPSGVLPLVMKAAAEDEIAVTCQDPLIMEKWEQEGLVQPLDRWLFKTVRDYQELAVEAAIKAHRGIISAPTGAGKTFVFAAIAQRIPVRWLFLVHKLDLLNQGADALESWLGEEVGYVGDGDWVERRVTVATYQTLYKALTSKSSERRTKALHLLQSVDGVCADECHVVAAATTNAILFQTNAYWRFGISGTPLARGDRRSVMTIGALGPVIHRVQVQALIEQGVLARPTIRMVPSPAPTILATTPQGVYGAGVVRNTNRNKLLTEIALAAAKPALLFVKEIDHGEELSKRLSKAGLQQEFVFGKDSVAFRREAIRRLERADTEILICSVVFNEGIDIPSLASVIVGAAGRSVIAALQRIGRGMRSDGGRKTEFEVWDIFDTGHRWLEAQAKARRRAYEQQGHKVKLGPLAKP